MVHAFVMIKVGAGAAEEVLSRVREVEAVTEAHVVAGEFDLVAEVDAPGVYEVLDAVASAIQGLPDVLDTRTYVSMDE